MIEDFVGNCEGFQIKKNPHTKMMNDVLTAHMDHIGPKFIEHPWGRSGPENEASSPI